jgi:hypothetical protein
MASVAILGWSVYTDRAVVAKASVPHLATTDAKACNDWMTEEYSNCIKNKLNEMTKCRDAVVSVGKALPVCQGLLDNVEE